jgi:hypothetical protein
LETIMSVSSLTSSPPRSGITLAAVDPSRPLQHDDNTDTDRGRAFVLQHPHPHAPRLGSSKPGGRERARTTIPPKRRRPRLSLPVEGTVNHIRHHHHVEDGRQLEQPILSARS